MLPFWKFENGVSIYCFTNEISVKKLKMISKISEPIRNRMKKSLKKLSPSLSDNFVAPRIFYHIEKNLSRDSTVLILGCGEGGAGTSELSTEFLEKNVIGSDIRKTDFADMIADAQDLPYRDESADAVICQAVLEHVKNSSKVISEIIRVLKPGGYLFVDVPFLQGYHALPHDYRRFTLTGLETELDDLEKIESGVSVGPTTTLLWINIEYFSYFFSFGNKFMKNALAFGLRLIFHRLKHLDKYLLSSHGPQRSLLKIPSAVYWYGKKPDEEL